MEAVIPLLQVSHVSTRGRLQDPEGGQEEQNLENMATKELPCIIPTYPYYALTLPWIHKWLFLLQVCSLFDKSALIYFWYNSLHK